ncbi:MAG: NADP-dependent phosphogluconate dehydrogenase, partial [Flavobacteriaceae bacterium]|nr:NADP-dependent phosphogluconate dehydrogenase [Flavobacteriaceae bacterium]
SLQLISERMRNRTGHYMGPEMLQSQFDALEIPDYGLHLEVTDSPEALIPKIRSWLQQTQLSQLGIVGLGVMGRNLALNALNHHVSVSVYNRKVAQENDLLDSFLSDCPDKNAQGFDEFEGFIKSLERPRKIVLMIKAGEAVDEVIEQLLEFLERGDILIDGGNSFYRDTERRYVHLLQKAVHFIGMGISGGAEGALYGPSMMPGGDRHSYDQVYPILSKIAAIDQHDQPCLNLMGPGGSGHFVKMIHNGIEYAEMQLLSEIYGLLRVAYNNEQIASIFDRWSASGSDSFLLQISSKILLKTDKAGKYIVDQILDVAGSKGTGNWAAQQALELNVPGGMINSAVEFRMLSGFKDSRLRYAENLKRRSDTHAFSDFELLQQAYDSARLINHHQGFEILAGASANHNWDLDLSEIARIWTQGCIIRSELMNALVDVFAKDISILDDKDMFKKIARSEAALKTVIQAGFSKDIAMPCFSNALNFWLAITSKNLATNLIQAQRDFFGNHGYKRRDSESDKLFNTDWE